MLKNDATTIAEIKRLQPKAIILGPGPGTPDDAGITLAVIEKFQDRLPLLGICLGHQAIAQAFGASIIRSHQVMHGRTSNVHHNSTGLFTGLASPTLFTRYHSLVVDSSTIPSCLCMTAWASLIKTDNDNIVNQNSSHLPNVEIMALQHRELPIFGVQFHPESILSQAGMLVLDNFLILNHLKSDSI